MRILILGGSPNHLGGVETFGDRAQAALARHAPDLDVGRLWTQTAYLRLARIGQIVSGIARMVAVRGRRSSVVWLQYVNLPDLLYLLAAKLAGFKVIVTPHLGSNWASQRNAVLRAFSRFALSRADYIALIAPTQAGEIALPNGTPNSLIRTFLPHEVLEPAPAQAQPETGLRLIHASRLSEAKGTFQVVEICRALHEAGVPFSAEIVGAADADTLARLRALIARYGLQDQVVLAGWLPPAQLIERLRTAHLLIHPSRTDSYPLILLEALACGVLPIALDLPGARSIVEAYDGWIVAPSTAVAEAAAIARSVTVADVRARGSQNAERVRSDFAWSEAVDHFRSALSATAPQV